MPETTLPDLVADLVASRHAGGYRFKVQQQVLRQFADHCQRQGYPDGSITREAVEGSFTAVTCGRPRSGATSWRCANWPTTPKPSAGTPTHRPRQLASGSATNRRMCSPTMRCAACSPRSTPRPMSCYSNKALVDPVLFRVFYGAGLRVSEALNLTLSDVDTQRRDAADPRFEER